MPALHLSLQLDNADVFGSLEWVLANARRTGLSLAQMHFDASRANAVRLHCAAPAVELLELFVRRVAHGVDLDIVDAEFSDDVDAVEAQEPLAA
ncbi:AsnC family transcriptional regulator [Cupriavidus sp. SZY C1]|uniref:AsnC family transcriptional regulator n=1 Tax=Cupriavidus sp. SZY C1 TaxID=3055037 RepID=UPI0028B37629|nr:AsnC family transcriptional regulator [Cupriavidus sp. SZY C1]MDT6961835.1 AsnC family transcriptional regulator [Cupriavidus sp. SZY C1]